MKNVKENPGFFKRSLDTISNAMKGVSFMSPNTDKPISDIREAVGKDFDLRQFKVSEPTAGAKSEVFGFVRKHPLTRWIKGAGLLATAVAGTASVTGCGGGGGGGGGGENNDDGGGDIIDNGDNGIGGETPNESGEGGLDDITISTVDGENPNVMNLETGDIYEIQGIKFLSEDVKAMLNSAGINTAETPEIPSNQIAEAPMYISNGEINTLINVDIEHSDIRTVTMVVQFEDGTESEIDVDISNTGQVNVQEEIERVYESIDPSLIKAIKIDFNTAEGQKRAEVNLTKAELVSNEDCTMCYKNGCAIVDPNKENQTIKIPLEDGTTLIVIVKSQKNDDQLEPENTPPTGENVDMGTVEVGVTKTGQIKATDAEGNPLTFKVVAGAKLGEFVLDENTGEYSYTAEQPGEEAITVIVNDGQADSALIKITVKNKSQATEDGTTDQNLPQNEAPVGQSTSVLSVKAGESVSGQVIFVDPNGSPVNCSLQVAPRKGSIENFSNLNGVFYFTYKASPGQSGQDTFMIAGSDGELSGFTVVTINITPDETTPETPVNNAPENVTTSTSVVEGGTTSGKISFSDKDGDFVTCELLQPPAKGTVTVATDGSYTYTANAGASGSDIFTVLGKDGKDGVGTATVNLDISAKPNTAPESLNPSFSTSWNTPLAIDVASLGRDLDGDTISVMEISGSNLFTAESNKITYNPDGQSGTKTCNYTIADGKGGVVTGTLTVTELAKPNTTPEVSIGTTFTTITGGDMVIIPISALATDADADALTFMDASISENGQNASVSFNGTSLIVTTNIFCSGMIGIVYGVTDGKANGNNWGSVNINVNPYVAPPPVTPPVVVPPTGC